MRTFSMDDIVDEINHSVARFIIYFQNNNKKIKKDKMMTTISAKKADNLMNDERSWNDQFGFVVTQSFSAHINSRGFF